MRRRHVVVLVMVVLSSPLFGCITLAGFVSVDTIRAEEPRQAVHFESTAVAEDFEKAVQDRWKSTEGKVGGRGFSVLFLTCYEQVTRLSENAFYNDQVTACDLDRDGIITHKEVEFYRQRYAGEKNKTCGD